MYADYMMALFSESVEMYYDNITELETCVIMLKNTSKQRFFNKDKIKCN